MQEQVKAKVDQASRILEPMQPGEAVLVQDFKTRKWTTNATIISRRNSRSYEVDIDGRSHVRNRRFLRPVAASGSLPNNNVHNPKACDKKKIHNLRSRHKVKFDVKNSSASSTRTRGR